MQRRQFIRNTSLAGLSILVLNTEACHFLAADQPPLSTDLEEATLDQLQQKMQNGQLTARALTDAYLKRIAEIDRGGPQLRSVIELNPDAQAIADALDAERKSGKVRGPLHGIPVLFKDNIDTADKMQTTAGALAMEGNIAAQDAFLVTRLREAGAVILGKTNLSEWANFRSTRSSSGWSSRGGQTKNPYVIDRSPCGSSSGSAVAVAANLCVVAVGTETDGSIACPASVNGIVGIKPTLGLVSRSGIIPISKTQDTAGPFGRSVRDAVLLLNVLAATDKNDSATLESAGKSTVDYTSFLDPNALQGKRIGIEKAFLKHHEGVDSLLANALEVLKKQGATIVEVEYRDALQESGDAEFDVLKYEFKDGLNRYLAGARAPVKNLQEIIEFNRKNEARAMPFFKQEILESSEALGDLTSKPYLEALEKSNVATQKVLNTLMEKLELDAFCGPSTGASWCIDPVNGDHWPGYGAYSPAAVAGFPSVTVPMGLVQELPVGLTFFGKAWDDGGMIGLAYAYEQAARHRVAPKFMATVTVNAE